jgi:glycosyltransferase involved in cell wall biosynthesis
MVPAEAMAHGTPAIVPDHGGVRGAVSAEGSRGGLVFRAWDSGDLAQQIRRLLTDDELWRSLARAAPRVADYYSVANLADRMLAHLEIRQPRRANAA